MKKIIFAIVLFSALIAPAYAYTDLNFYQRFGEGGYAQTDASILLGSGAFSVKPGVKSWKSDTSSGTFTTYALRLDYAGRVVKAGVEGGLQPKTDGYDKKYVGGDISYSFYPSKEGEDSLYLRFDIGVAAMFTFQADEYQLLSGSTGGSGGGGGGRGPGGGGGGSVVLRTQPFDLQQRDYTVFAGAGIGIVELSGDYTKTNYNQTILPTDRSSRNLSVIGLDHITQGFLDNSWSAKVKLMAGIFRPFVSYTSIRILDLTDREQSYGAGLEIKWKMLKVRGSYELYKPGNGAEDGSYYGIGGTLMF
ncbi:MAG TPA: hypothetical protein PLL10_01525 [Elusimicrobiales bacterium]|nr:hypothetical protein [Elusimicrobiales bacterium]